MADFEVLDNGDKLGVFTVGSNVSGANNTSNVLANVNAGAAGYVAQGHFVGSRGLTLTNLIVDATPANQNKVIGVALLEAPKAGQECAVQQSRIARVIVGGAVAVDADVFADIQGRAVDTAVADMDSAVQGIALTDAAAAGQYISVLLSK